MKKIEKGSYTVQEMIDCINDAGYEEGRKIYDSLPELEKTIIKLCVKEQILVRENAKLAV